MSQVGLSQTSQGFYILLFLDCTFMSAITHEILAVSCPWKQQGNFLRSQTNLKSHFWYYRCFQEGICGLRVNCGKLVYRLKKEVYITNMSVGYKYKKKFQHCPHKNQGNLWKVCKDLASFLIQGNMSTSF